MANRRLLNRKLIDIENHIRGALRTYGLKVGQVSRATFEARVRELLDHADPIFEVMITTMLDVRRSVHQGYDRLHKIPVFGRRWVPFPPEYRKILPQVVIHYPLCRHFMTVPGVGPAAALSLKVAVDDPLRSARSCTCVPPFTKRHMCR